MEFELIGEVAHASLSKQEAIDWVLSNIVKKMKKKKKKMLAIGRHIGWWLNKSDEQ